MNVQVTLEELQIIFPAMRSFFDSGKTLDIAVRKNALRSLKASIEKNTDKICEAVFKDFHKPKAEMLLTEIFTVITEIDHTISSLDKWVKPSTPSTNILLMPASSKIHKSPKGIILIISPWNYPFYLTMMPLISAIAAGNCCIIKPANETYFSSLVIKELIDETFDAKHAKVVLGEGAFTGDLLLDHFEFNHIFFTGSARVGSLIMAKAATNLTPVTLELGGKSPAIIEKGYDLNRAAKKIVWGKFINCGQTCVATDYVLVHKDDEATFIEACIIQIRALFGDDVFSSDEYAHMINDVRFDKVVSYLVDTNILYGGKHDKETRCIEPTLVSVDNLNQPIMKEEIFGPILPIISYENQEDIVHIVRKNRYPLALYLFNNYKNFEKFIFNTIEFGGGCQHNTVYHLGNPHLPFGGIQKSGMGQYHGQIGFDTFSNTKSVLSSAKWFDLDLLYQPYTINKLNIIKRLFKL
jgi:aldehyde dehydrogenase (NAD+)